MNSQIMFKLDKKLKDSAMKKAEAEGITLSSVLKLSIKAFVEDDLKVGLTYGGRLNARIEKELEKIDEDINRGKNISPAFKNAKSAISYLKKESKKACR
ncbi:hypothetical protein HY249_02240 [Candidatus Azambacteria bacterium]|nr:hypothetical protein [Candidatus Azambacteria bacterium]